MNYILHSEMMTELRSSSPGLIRHSLLSRIWRGVSQAILPSGYLKAFFAALTILVLIFFCGCASDDQMRFKAGNGDAGQFILRQAVIRGGHLITTNGLPVITGPWQYSEDKYGVIIQLPRSDYEAVEKTLAITFGKPTFGPGDTTDGGKLGGYRLTPKGGAIQFGYDAEGTHVIIIRQLTQEEFADGLIRAMKTWPK